MERNQATGDCNMTPAQIAEITRRARQHARAMQSGWPTKGNPYQQQAEADLYEEEFQKALKEVKR